MLPTPRHSRYGRRSLGAACVGDMYKAHTGFCGSMTSKHCSSSFKTLIETPLFLFHKPPPLHYIHHHHHNSTPCSSPHSASSSPSQLPLPRRTLTTTTSPSSAAPSAQTSCNGAKAATQTVRRRCKKHQGTSTSTSRSANPRRRQRPAGTPVHLWLYQRSIHCPRLRGVCSQLQQRRWRGCA